MTLFKIVVRDRQQAKEDERIDDVYRAEITCVAPGEMGNRGRHQRDREAGVREFLHLEWNGGDHERKHTKDLGDCQLNLEVRRESKMGEPAFTALRKRKKVVEYEGYDAEQHHGQHKTRAHAARRHFSPRRYSTPFFGW